jgi:prepilin-type N-terminal cleavage/methylation domain-containing protein
MTKSQYLRKTGFTLIELSSSLVIIALIIGSVQGGVSLVKSANTKKIISEYTNYNQAINTFKIQYNSLPGDITTASILWSNCDATGASNSSYCNGNGNGLIEPGNTTSIGGITPAQEGKMAWRHLSLSNIISGNYDGVMSATVTNNTANTYPISAKSGLVWAFDETNLASSTIYSAANSNSYGNVLILINYTNAGTANNFTFSPGLTPAESYNVDQKIDDGMPSTGKVAAFQYAFSLPPPASPQCTSSATWPPAATNAYNFALDSAACTMFFYYD